MSSLPSPDRVRLTSLERYSESQGDRILDLGLHFGHYQGLTFLCFSCTELELSHRVVDTDGKTALRFEECLKSDDEVYENHARKLEDMKKVEEKRERELRMNMQADYMEQNGIVL